MSASRDSLALSLVDATSAVLVESDYDSDVEFSDSSDESSSDLLPSDAEDELDEALAGFVAESGDSDGEIRHDGDEDEDDDGDGVSDHDDGEPSKGSGPPPAPATFYRGTARGTTRARARGRASSSRGRARGIGRGGNVHTRGRGRGRGGGRGRDQASGVAHGSSAHAPKSWTHHDTAPSNIPAFSPSRPAGLHLPNDFLPENELSFFKLFFTASVISSLVDFTNTYAAMNIVRKPYYAMRNGSWMDVTADEIYNFIAVLIYFGLVRVSKYESYWSSTALYNGLWGRQFFSRRRFKSLLAFFHCSEPLESPQPDKLHKVRFLLDHVQKQCMCLWQPRQFISIDERMIKFKGRHSM